MSTICKCGIFLRWVSGVDFFEFGGPPRTIVGAWQPCPTSRGGTLAGLVDLRPFEVSRKHFSDDNKRCLFNPFALDPFGKL